MIIGNPPLKLGDMKTHPQRPGEKMSLANKLRFYLLVLRRLPSLYRYLPPAVKMRAKDVRRRSYLLDVFISD